MLPMSKEYSNINMSSAVRYLEAINVFDHLLRNGQLLIGEGFGGYFQDRLIPFAHLVYGTTTYPDQWIAAGTLYKPHTFPILLLLKMGSVGVIVMTIIIWRVLFGWLRHRHCVTYQEKIFFATVASAMIVLFYKSFNIKLQIIQSAILYVVLAAQSEIAHCKQTTCINNTN